MGRIDGKVAIITGAAGGIGCAAARRFVDEGAKVVLVDRDRERLDELAAEFRPNESIGVVGDVADEATAQAFVAEAMRVFGRLDIALLNAGAQGTVGPIDSLPVSVFDRVMATNVRSVWLGLAAVMPVMRDGGGGSIVTTASVAGLRGSANLAAYAASKHAVIGLMKSAAREGAAHKVRVNSVNPAQTRTPMMEFIDDAMQAIGARPGNSSHLVPLGRYAEPEEVAAMMLFLASDESRFCTGGVYLVDGGSMS